MTTSLALVTMLASVTPGQCYPDYYYSPPPVYYSAPYTIPSTIPYTCPTPTTSLADTECTHFSGTIHSKKYITAVLENGKRITVPVINGYLPSIDLTALSNGAYRRDYYYDECIPYKGQSVVSYGSTKQKATAPAPRVMESVTQDYSHRAAIEESSSFDDRYKRPPVVTETRTNDLPPKRITMPQPDPELKKLQEELAAIRAVLKEMNERTPPPSTTLPKETAPAPRVTTPAPKVEAPPPRAVETPPSMRRPSEFGKDEPPKK